MEEQDNNAQNEAIEVSAEDMEDLFELETLVPPAEANSTSCCQIVCFAKKHIETTP